MNEGEIFGEIAFFTEVPQLEGVRACSVARVLSVPRNAYNGTAAAFPLGARSLLENLRVRAQQVRQFRVSAWDLATGTNELENVSGNWCGCAS